MSTQFTPRSIIVENDLLEDVERGLDRQETPFTARARSGGRTEVTVAPSNADRLADAVERARASKERERQASLREVEASIDVGGLSVEDARRLVESLQDAPRGATVRDLPEDLQRALGVAAPDHDAVIRVRFSRNHTPGRAEVQNWVADALRTYFDEYERYCGLDPDVDADEAIIDVRVESVEAVQDS